MDKKSPQWAQSAALAANVLFLLVISSRVVVFLHEVVGHGLAAELLGGDCLGVVIQPFGGGWPILK